MNGIKNNKGLTLIEILITLAVLGIVVSPLMSMFITSQKINNESEMKYRAVQLAQQHIETIKAMKQQLDDTEYPPRSGGYGKEFSYSNGYTIDVIIKKGDNFGGSDIDASKIPEDTEFDIKENISSGGLHQIDVGSGVDNIKINIDFSGGGTADIILNGSTSGVRVYIFNENQNSYTITGNATIIEVPENAEKPDNQLYEIIAEVKKDGKLIDTIKGTTVFKFNP